MMNRDAGRACLSLYSSEPGCTRCTAIVVKSRRIPDSRSAISSPIASLIKSGRPRASARWRFRLMARLSKSNGRTGSVDSCVGMSLTGGFRRTMLRRKRAGQSGTETALDEVDSGAKLAPVDLSATRAGALPSGLRFYCATTLPGLPHDDRRERVTLLVLLECPALH